MFCKGLQRDGRDRFHCRIVIEDPPDRNRLSCRRCRYRDSGIGIGPPLPDPLRLWNGLAGAREQLRRRSGGASWPSMGWGCLSGSRVTSDDWRAWPGDADVQKPSLQRSFCGLQVRGGARCKAAGRSHPMSAGLSTDTFDKPARLSETVEGCCAWSCMPGQARMPARECRLAAGGTEAARIEYRWRTHGLRCGWHGACPGSDCVPG